ncbi:hypothetical protein [Microtetraspora niveoalba]|uniref:hypothetical protein n=1 Tax=Microtetraspora niveoalba TaxID=46175 RepID=UPI00082DDBF2|nr:hypothetical protein [Microtetraspora niveoalba]
MSPLAAFLDEADVEPAQSRQGIYLVAAALVENAEANLLRTFLRSLVQQEDVDPKHGFGRLHVSRIKDKQRKTRIVATLGMLRGITFWVGRCAGYGDPREREHVRRLVLDGLLPWLAKAGAEQIVIEQREDAALRAADMRTVAHLRSAGQLPDIAVHQAPPSADPLLWVADSCAAAWRRAFLEDKSNWSSWYETHTTLVEVAYEKRKGR